MATVKREPIANLHENIIVSLTKEDYLPAFEKALRKYSKNANIPGFRKGNVPAGMIKKMYGPGIYNEEVIRVAYDELENYLKEAKPSIFAQPIAASEQDLVMDMNNPGDMEFKFEIGLKPDFEVTPLQEKGKLTRYTIRVSEEMVDKEIAEIRKRSGKMENPETVEAPSDMLYLNYYPATEAGEVAEHAEKLEDVAELEKMPETLAKELNGKQPGFSYVFQPEAVCTPEELEGFMKSALKKGPESKAEYFKLELDKIGRVLPRTMDEEFFKEVFPDGSVADEATLREKIAGELGKELYRVSTDRLQNDIFETLVHETPIELPVDFLKQWMKRGGEKVRSDEEVEQEFSSFDHQLRWTLISDKLIKEYNIEVTIDEVMQDVKGRMMAYFGISNEEDAPWLESYLERMTKDEKSMDETYRRLLFDKLFTRLEEVLEVRNEEVDDKEFAELPQAHQHA